MAVTPALIAVGNQESMQRQKSVPMSKRPLFAFHLHVNVAFIQFGSAIIRYGEHNMRGKHGPFSVPGFTQTIWGMVNAGKRYVGLLQYAIAEARGLQNVSKIFSSSLLARIQAFLPTLLQ